MAAGDTLINYPSIERGSVLVTLVLLIGASLFVRSFLNLQSASAGFDSAPLLTMRYFMSGEDLTIQPGLALQQDLALVSLLAVGCGGDAVKTMLGNPEMQTKIMDAIAGNSTRPRRAEITTGRSSSAKTPAPIRTPTTIQKGMMFSENRSTATVTGFSSVLP